MADKVDFKKTLESYRAPSASFLTVDVPEMTFLMIDGHGDPNTSPAYSEALKALYPVAYKLNFMSKRELERDYVVPPLEGLWWAEDMDAFTRARDKSQWKWTMMLMVPEWLAHAEIEHAREQVSQKDPPSLLSEVRVEVLEEGLCVQTLHIGAFDEEGPVLERMHNEFIPSLELTMTGKHHEIYLSDPRSTPSEKLRTILRQPVGS